MQQRLPDIERTLLSAYLDGELSAAERQEAERLLESSDGARAYLRDLRAVNSVTIGAFPTIPAGLGAGGTIAGGKLTAGAISRAATNAGGIGSLSSGWGLAGLAAAAAIVVAGYSFLGGTADKAVVDHGADAPAVSPATSSAPLQVLGVDTASFIIPAMTPAELIDFAVEGTLPVDVARERFITVTPNGENTLSVNMHAGETRRITIAEDLGVTGLRRLDSVHQMVRTALVPYSKNSIAIRSDLPLLRLQVLEQLSESMATMPAEVRQEIERVRVELRNAHRDVERTRSILLSGHGRYGTAVQGSRVLYIPIESEQVRRFTVGEWHRMPAPASFTIMLNSSRCMVADQVMLEAASAGSFPTLLSAPRPTIGRTETRVGAGVGDPTAGAPPTSKRTKVNLPPPAAEPVAPPAAPPSRSPRIETRSSQDELDELLRKAETSLQNARESLRRAEELNRQQGNNRNSSGTNGSEGAGGDDHESDPDPDE